MQMNKERRENFHDCENKKEMWRLEIYSENLRCKHETYSEERASESFMVLQKILCDFLRHIISHLGIFYGLSFASSSRKSYRRFHCPRHLDTNSKWQLKHN